MVPCGDRGRRVTKGSVCRVPEIRWSAGFAVLTPSASRILVVSIWQWLARMHTHIHIATLHYTLKYEYTHRSNGHRLSAGRAAFSPAVALPWWTKTIGISRSLLELVIRRPRNPQPNSSRCRFSFDVPRSAVPPPPSLR